MALAVSRDGLYASQVPSQKTPASDSETRLQEALADPEALPDTLTGDKGYFSLLEIGRLQELSLKTVISDLRRF